jgi:uncharacterized repeat protein (TIGR03803 family)
MKRLIISVAAVIAASAQTFTSLASFNGSNGASPEYLSLVQGIDGNFYGTTSQGGLYGGGYGVVFQVTPTGMLTAIHNFTGAADGGEPYAGLALGLDGDLYGPTNGGGVYGVGVIFKINDAGVIRPLHDMTGLAGGFSFYAGLVLGENGNFYGVSTKGGRYGYGAIFEVTPAGKLTSLYSFTGGADGATPYARLLQLPRGDLYGTAYAGGANGLGTVFKVTPGGAFTTLHSFTGGADGAAPIGGLAAGADGNLYGTTCAMGPANPDNFCSGAPSGFGTVFRITPAGVLTTIYAFTGAADGSSPRASLVLGSDGNFYGATTWGGTFTFPCELDGCGTIFEVTPAGVLTTLHTFDGGNSIEGYEPYGGLVQGTDGGFYGTTVLGGAQGSGIIYSLSTGLGPFVKPVPHAAKVGAAIIILGTNLTGTTSVAFNGIPATFTVNSASEITASVPTGATSGQVQVMTLEGTLSGPFFVIP